MFGFFLGGVMFFKSDCGPLALVFSQSHCAKE